MISNRYLRLLHSASESSRNHGTETNRQCTVKEVKEEGGERKVRCVMGIKPDGSEWLSPWMSTQEQRSGQERSQSSLKPGQNGVIQGSFRQGTFSSQGEATHAQQPKHAPQTNGPSQSVGKKFRSATHGGQDDQQQGGGQSGGGQSGGSGGQSGGGGQQQEKEHYAAHEKGAKIRAGTENYFVSEKDKKNLMRSKIDNYVHAVEGQNFVNKPWVIKDSPKDPVPNHDEQSA